MVAERMGSMMDKQWKLELIRETGIIAIMRAQNPERLVQAAEAIWAGGVRVIEVTMTTPGALQVIGAATEQFGQTVLFGAGSVLDAETARAAILSGAGFVVSPTLSLDVIRMCRRYSIPVLPGCFTSSEALTAWEAGADMIKLFPASLGGPHLIKALLAPLPQLQIVPVGGVDLTNAADYARSGAVALGVGGSLVNQKLLDAADMSELTRRAAAFVQAFDSGR